MRPLLAPANEVVIIAPDDYDDGGSLDQKLTPSYGKSLPEAKLLTIWKLLGGQPDGG